MLFTAATALGFAPIDLLTSARQSQEWTARTLTERLSDFAGWIRSDWRKLEPRRLRMLLISTVLGLILVLDLFAFGVLRRLGESAVASAYNGDAIGPFLSLFTRITTDPYKTPLQLFLDRYDRRFGVMGIVLTGTVTAAV